MSAINSTQQTHQTHQTYQTHQTHQTQQTQQVTITVSNNAGQYNYQSGKTRWRNKPQSTTTIAASFIFLSAGMNLALGLGWSQYTFFAGILHFCYSWFIGVIIGTILATPLRMVISKRFIFGASSVLIFISGIIFASNPFNYNALLAGRYLNGIAVGLATVTYLLYASEVSVDSRRGSLVALEQYSLTCGMAIQMIYASYWTWIDYSINRVHGIFDIIFGIIAGVLLILYIESPTDQIRWGDEAGALNSMAKLQRPGHVTIETTAWLEQCKMYVREHESMSLQTSMRHAAAPLIKMIFVRSVILAFCYSMPLNIVLQYIMVARGSTWLPTVAGCCRILGAMITLACINNFRRKVLSSMGIMFIGGTLLGLGIICLDLTGMFLDRSMAVASSALYIVMQLFAGFFTPYTSMLLAEAFPLRVKGYLMDVCIIVEQLLQIILINTVSANIGYSLMAQGLIVLLISTLAVLCIPETRGISLSEAQRRFRTVLYTKLN